MKNQSHRKNSAGFLSFESILATAFIIIFAMTVYSVYQFYSMRQESTIDPNDITKAYTYLLETLRHDSRLASAYTIVDEDILLKDSHGNEIASYRLMNNSLVRFEQNQTGRTIIENINQVEFRTHPYQPNLLMVKVFPINTMDIPFFTSFAMRGEKDEK